MQAQNVAAFVGHVRREAVWNNLLLRGVGTQCKNALDLAGKWPLSRKAIACGASPARLFIDAAQSTGHAGADDGAVLHSNGRVSYFEVKGSKGRKAGCSSFSFKGIRTKNTKWEFLLFIGREREITDWNDDAQLDDAIWIGYVPRTRVVAALLANERNVDDVHEATLTPGSTASWLGPEVQWARFRDLGNGGGDPVWWQRLVAATSAAAE